MAKRASARLSAEDEFHIMFDANPERAIANRRLRENGVNPYAPTPDERIHDTVYQFVSGVVVLLLFWYLFG